QVVRPAAFRAQDRPLLIGATQRVLAELAIAAYDPMARDEHRHRVLTQRRAYCAHRRRMADLCRYPAVGAHFAARDLARLEQHLLLELGQATQVELIAQVARRLPRLAQASSETIAKAL